jgi:hypothetical protein
VTTISPMKTQFWILGMKSGCVPSDHLIDRISPLSEESFAPYLQQPLVEASIVLYLADHTARRCGLRHAAAILLLRSPPLRRRRIA